MSAARPRRAASLLLIPLLVIPLLATRTRVQAQAQPQPQEPSENPLPTLAQKTEGLDHRHGFLDLWIDRERGKVWLELPARAPEGESPGVLARLLWVESLTAGFGSNPVGLDRGQIGATRVAHFRRAGGTVLFEVENVGFRADTDHPLERRAVEESFASSVPWAGPIAARTAGTDDPRILVDLTPFLLLDHHRIGPRLMRQGEGTWTLDAERSAVDPEAVLAFPDNVEIDALLTYQGKEPGTNVRSITAVPGTFTLVGHHSFVRLPDPGFTPRPFDPRAGSYAVTFRDYAAPLDAPIEKRYAARFRLHKTDPSKPSSPVEKPIVFYVDRGAPEPVRSALVEGASWWAEAFSHAGFENAYRVELLPEGAHPMDVRYNVIQWVHRSTRGWSYGGGVIDPRTGEILKGHVNLGSLRVRQDRRIFEALLGTEKTGSGAPDDPVELALARIRQLAAHEVGHALGFTHNFAASTNDRASVMDYPAPWIRAREDGSLDVSRAYAVGVGAWDLHAVRWAYTEVPPGADEPTVLDRIVREGLDAGLRFVADQDARPPGSAHPLGSLWDNGADPVAELANVMAVRRAALTRFGARNLAPGQPLARLQEVLAPLYLYHRYQVEAVIHSVGGLDFSYALRGDGQPPPRAVPAARQRQALDAALGTLDPAELDLPDRILALLPPRPSEYNPDPEMFRGASDPLFDPLAAAAGAADLVIRLLLEPHRAARLVDFHRRDPEMPGLGEVIEALVARVFTPAAQETPRRAEIRRTVEGVTIGSLIDLAADGDASPAVRGTAEGALRGLEVRLGGEGRSDEEVAHRLWLVGEIGRWLDRRGPESHGPWPPPPAPPGSPIGAGGGWDLASSWGGCEGYGP